MARNKLAERLEALKDFLSHYSKRNKMSEQELDRLFADLRKVVRGVGKTDAEDLASSIQYTEKKLADPKLTDQERKIQEELLSIYQEIIRRSRGES